MSKRVFEKKKKTYASIGKFNRANMEMDGAHMKMVWGMYNISLIPCVHLYTYVPQLTIFFNIIF